ncbi:hypothetical protein U1Q18_031904 [Sarracenia purpurea var. burkii]
MHFRRTSLTFDAVHFRRMQSIVKIETHSKVEIERERGEQRQREKRDSRETRSESLRSTETHRRTDELTTPMRCLGDNADRRSRAIEKPRPRRVTTLRTTTGRLLAQLRSDADTTPMNA